MQKMDCKGFLIDATSWPRFCGWGRLCAKVGKEASIGKIKLANANFRLAQG